jgi:multidrug efflux system outer membrane protein
MRSRLIAPPLALVLLAACSVSPEPLTLEQTAGRAASDRARLMAAQEPVTGPVTLEEALARALAHNLDNRLAMFEQALQSRQLDAAQWDLLPRLAANAGYVARDRELVTTSRNVRTGAIGADPSGSVDRNRYFGDLTLTWNILDFGASYYQAKQQADRVLIASERRRRTVNNIFQEVRAAYWQAVAAQRVLPRLDPVVADARRALETARTLERDRLRSPLEALRYQRAVIDLLRRLEAVRGELAVAKSRLGQLMGLPPGTAYDVVVPPADALAVPDVPYTLDQLERAALVGRPELREEDYNVRIAQAEARRSLLRLLPGVSLFGSLNYDSNSFLEHQNWAEAGVRVTLNILDLFSAPTRLRAVRTQEELAEMRRLAISMAVLTQVHVSVQELQRARVLFEQAALAEAVERRIAALAAQQRAADAGSELDRIREQAAAVVAELERDRAYADLQNALALLLVALGRDPLPETVEARDLRTIAASIRRVGEDWSAGRVAIPDLPEAEAEPLPDPGPAAVGPGT